MKLKETPQWTGPETNASCGKGTKKADRFKLPYLYNDRDFCIFADQST